MTRDDVPVGGSPGDAGGRWDAMGCMWWWWIIIIIIIIIIIWWFFSWGRGPATAPGPVGGPAAPVYRAPAEPRTGTGGGTTGGAGTGGATSTGPGSTPGTEGGAAGTGAGGTTGTGGGAAGTGTETGGATGTGGTGGAAGTGGAGMGTGGGEGTGGTMESPGQEPQRESTPPTTQPTNDQGTSGDLSPYLLPGPALA